MKNLLVVGLCAVFATSVFASELGIQFDPADPNTVNGQNATVVRGGTVTVQMLWTQDSSTPSGISAVSFSFTSVPENPAPGLQGEMVEDPDIAFVGEVTPTLPGWLPSQVAGNIGGLAQVSPFASSLANTWLAPGTAVVGTFVILVADDAALGLHPFYILRNPLAISPDVVGGDGFSQYTYSASPAPNSGSYSVGSGFAGSNIDVMRSDDSIPLMINVVPEPATLTLLSLGGLVVLRRRLAK